MDFSLADIEALAKLLSPPCTQARAVEPAHLHPTLSCCRAASQHHPARSPCTDPHPTQAARDDDATPISELTKPTPACIGPKDLLHRVKVASPKGERGAAPRPPSPCTRLRAAQAGRATCLLMHHHAQATTPRTHCCCHLLLPRALTQTTALGRSTVQAASAATAAELQQHDADEDDGGPGDGREAPEHRFCYQQRVTAADNFLGLSGKDPSCACCEQLVVVVDLPKAVSASELQLDTTSTWVRLQSPHYRLRLALPHKVDEERGAAKWDGKTKRLSITLPILRDQS